MILSKSSLEFLERTGFERTLRQPMPLMTSDNPVLFAAVEFPLPHADRTRLEEDGDPAPDRLTTLVWPHGGPPAEGV